MRPLQKVIEAAINIVPDNFEGKAALRQDLGGILESIPYTAPEIMKTRWDQFIEALRSNVPLGDELNIESSWQSTLMKMVADQLDYKDYLGIETAKTSE